MKTHGEFDDEMFDCPTDLSLGFHTQCYNCGMWHPDRMVTLYLGQVRCPECRADLAACFPIGQTRFEGLLLNARNDIAQKKAA